MRIIYGYLYTWACADTAEGATSIANTGPTCPISGYKPWRVPSVDDLTTMESYLFALDVGAVPGNVAAYLKSRRSVNADDPAFRTTIHPRWEASSFQNIDYFNIGFIPGEYRHPDGHWSWVSYPGQLGCYWTSTEVEDRGTAVDFVAWSNQYYPGTWAKTWGHSLRLIREVTEAELNPAIPDGSYLQDYIGNDGKRYKVVKVGGFAVMAENLAETKLRSGASIDKVTGNEEWDALTDTDLAYCAFLNTEGYAVGSTVADKPKLNKITKKTKKERVIFEKDPTKKESIFKKVVTDEDPISYVNTRVDSLYSKLLMLANPFALDEINILNIISGIPGEIAIVLEEGIYPPLTIELLFNDYVLRKEQTDLIEHAFGNLNQRGDYKIRITDALGRVLLLEEDHLGNPLFVAGDNLNIQSTIGVVDNVAMTVTDVPSDTTMDDFYEALSSTDGSTQYYLVLTGPGGESAVGTVPNGGVIIVVAENGVDGVDVERYTITTVAP